MQKLKKLLTESQVIKENHYGQDHIDTASILLNLGKTYLLENNLESAETYLIKAHAIFQRDISSECYSSFELLADLFLKKSESARNTGDIQAAEAFKKQTSIYLMYALKIIQDNFPKNSHHFIRISSKIKKNE